MSGGTVPVQMCDSEDGCTEWMLNHYETGATNWKALLDGWTFNPRSDRAFCPEHRN